MISHPGAVSLPLLFFLLFLFIEVVAVALVPFIVTPLCPLLLPHIKIELVPRVGIVIVFALLLLQNGPIDTSPLLLPPLCYAAASVLLSADIIALVLLLRLLILLVNKK